MSNTVHLALDPHRELLRCATITNGKPSPAPGAESDGQLIAEEADDKTRSSEVEGVASQLNRQVLLLRHGFRPQRFLGTAQRTQ